jgi:hypothetical protein
MQPADPLDTEGLAPARHNGSERNDRRARSGPCSGDGTSVPNADAEPVVMIELGGNDTGTITIPDRLATLELVAAEIARGLVQLGQGRGLG